VYLTPKFHKPTRFQNFDAIFWAKLIFLNWFCFLVFQNLFRRKEEFKSNKIFLKSCLTLFFNAFFVLR
jgi:hypothetical protein